MSDKKYEPWLLLSVDIKQVGGDLIEGVGIVTGYQYANREVPAHIIRNMEEAIEKAQRALASYRRAVETHEEKMNRSRFSALAEGHTPMTRTRGGSGFVAAHDEMSAMKLALEAADKADANITFEDRT